MVSPCFNEADNVEAVHDRLAAALDGLDVDWRLLFCDNASTDGTVEVLRKLVDADPRVQVIVNSRNFGHIRSPVHGILQAEGDAVVLMASDLQDPPELVATFVEKWLAGSKVVLAVKSKSEETPAMYAVRGAYYELAGRLSEVKLVKNSTGFGLYDRQVVEEIRGIGDVYPYFRGLTAEIGFEPTIVEFTQPQRRRGITKNNFYTLYDMAMLGITSHSKVPLRLATMVGFLAAFVSLLVAVFYLVYKLINWNSFEVGLAPLVIGVFFFSSVQLFFLGVIGEYVGSIQTQVLHRPLVVERERINLDAPRIDGPTGR